MTTRMIIGNLISLLQVACLTLSCCAKTRRKVYALQMTEASLSALATVFFGAWSGLTTVLIAIYRNWRTMEDRFSAAEMVITAVLTVVIGVAVNTNGFIGLLPILATLELTAFNHYAHGIRLTKIGILINVLLWCIYGFGIGNIVGGCGEMFTFVVGLISLIRSGRTEQAYT